MKSHERFERGIPGFTPLEVEKERPQQISLFNRRILPWATDLMGANILDAASGNGRYSNKLEEKGFQVVSLDASPSMVQCQKGRFKKAIGTIDMIPFRGSYFDGVFLKDTIVLCNPEMRQRIFQEFSRVLQPKGKLLIISEILESIRIEFTHDAGRSTFEISEQIDWRKKVNMIESMTDVNGRVVSISFPTTPDKIAALAYPHFDIAEETILYPHIDQGEKSEWSNAHMLVMGLVKKTF